MSVTQQALAVGRAVAGTAPAATRLARRAAWARNTPGRSRSPCPTSRCSSPSSSIRSRYGLWLGSEPALYARTVRRSPLPDRRRQHAALCRHRREREDVPGLPAVGLLHAQALVDQGAAGGLHPALGDAGTACLHVDPLVPERPVGHAEQCPVHAVRHRRPGLPERPLDRAGVPTSAPISGRTCRSGRSSCWPAGWRSRRNCTRPPRWMAPPACAGSPT